MIRNRFEDDAPEFSDYVPDDAILDERDLFQRPTLPAEMRDVGPMSPGFAAIIARWRAAIERAREAS